MRPRTLLIVVAVSIATLASGYLLYRAPGETKNTQVLREQQGDLLYTYHILTGTEALFDVKRDPHLLRNLCRARPDDAIFLRLKLARRHGVADPGELRRLRADPLRERLKSLGYLQ